MIKAADCYARYGDPKDHKNMVMWTLPDDIRRKPLPTRIYLNKDLIAPLENALRCLIDSGFISELKTWDGCHNIRVIRGYEKQYESLMAEGKIAAAQRLMSIHSWGIAIDVNAATNGLGKVPTLSAGFVKCFTDAGFDWGGAWEKRPDGMHFQLSKLP